MSIRQLRGFLVNHPPDFFRRQFLARSRGLGLLRFGRGHDILGGGALKREQQ
jgi:hypothetical protein